MENFSTPARANLPWLANLATLAVVAVAIGWSSGQRPDEAAASLSQKAPAAAAAQVVAPAAERSPAAAQNRWPSQAVAAPLETMQTVGYSTAKLR